MRESARSNEATVVINLGPDHRGEKHGEYKMAALIRAIRHKLRLIPTPQKTLLLFVSILILLQGLFSFVTKIMDCDLVVMAASKEISTIRGANVILGSPRVCGRSLVKEEHVELLIVINSHPAHNKSRMMIRNTWLSSASLGNYGKTTRHVFLLGNAATYDFREVLTEYETYQDLLVLEIEDTFRNLTTKTLAGFEWISKNCPKSKFILKSDDDTYVNMTNLMDIFDRESKESLHGNYIVGSMHAGLRTAERTEELEKYLNDNGFPEHTLLSYVNGGSYMLPFHVASDIIHASVNLPYMYYEDIYIGLCIKDLGYSRNHRNGFNMKVSLAFSKSFLCKRSVVSVHNVTVREMQDLWNKCKPTAQVTLT